MGISDSLKKIESFGLYEATGLDWDLHITASLTEPVCPSASVRPESWNISRYSAWGDTIEEAVEKICKHLQIEFVDKKVAGHGAPWTNSHDAEFEKWLEQFVAGGSEKLPWQDDDHPEYGECDQ